MQENRETAVLHYLLLHGYAQAKILKEEVVQKSISTTRLLLRRFQEKKWIQYKGLPNNGKKGEPERVYSLTPDGLRALGKNKAEIAEYNQRLKRITLAKMRHYLLSQKVETTLLRCIQNSSYTAENYNEFNQDGQLHIPLKHKGKNHQICSDIHIALYKQKTQRLTLKIEVDNNTESLPILMHKLNRYFLAANTSEIEKHAQVFPIYVLFVILERKIPAICKKLQNQPHIAEFFLFLAVEDIVEKNRAKDIFREPIIHNVTGKKLSLLDLAEERDPILTFAYALQQASKRHDDYMIDIYTRYTTIHDSYFPILLDGYLFTPDGYCRIYARAGEEYQEKLFALVMVVENKPASKIREKLAHYETLLLKPEYRMRITKSRCYGVMAVCGNEARIAELQTMTTPRLAGKMRVVNLCECVPEKILDAKVWKEETNSTTLLPENSSSIAPEKPKQDQKSCQSCNPV